MKKYFIEKGENFRSWIQRDPTKLIRYIVLFICCIVVVVQLTECFLKVSYPPLTTYSHYGMNETMELPAVTICREPAYKDDILKHYNLTVHPKYFTFWTNFTFDTVNMTEMFLNSTYTKDEILIQYGLGGKPEWIDVTSTLHFNLGMCHTFRGLRPTKSFNRNLGYSIMLKHDMTKDEADLWDVDVGWHIFIHEPGDHFTEMRVEAAARAEYIFVDVEEEIEVKLTSQYFNMMTDGDRGCLKKADYSASKCAESCIWQNITARYQCSAPWIPDISLPYCSNYSIMSKLITASTNAHEADTNPPCNCPDPCHATLYSAFVMNRKQLLQPRPSTQLYVYYTSRLITIIEERPSYDLSQFVADIGGSVGFLLGLSVLGLIEILERVLGVALLWVVKKRKDDDGHDENSSRRSSCVDGSSDITTEISTISNNAYYRKSA